MIWVPRVTKVLVEAETREVFRQVDVLADGLMPFILSNQNAAIYETLDSISARYEDWHSLLLVRTDGRQLYPLDSVEVVDDEYKVSVSNLIMLRGDPWGHIAVQVDLSDQIANLHVELRRLAGAAIVFLLASVAAISFFVDRLVTRRLQILAAAADKMGSGNYHAVLPPSDGDEVGRLTESFGAMRQQILSNVSSLEEARQQAEHALETKSRFLATMSHELRTPLNGIIPVAELLKSSSLDNDQIRMVDTIKQSSQSLLTIVNDILDLAQVEEGRFEARKIHFNIHELANGVVDMLHATASQKGLYLNCEVDPLLAEFTGDEDRIRQILINLVGNAIKFTEVGGVTLRCRPLLKTSEWSKVLFDVEDTGIGIKPADQVRVFERFEQAEGGLTRRFSGSGLGLAITKKLVVALGGDIWLKSKPGQGSTFSFSVPLENRAMSQSESKQKASVRASSIPPPVSDSDALDILVADDSEINLEVAVAILRGLGHRVASAKNGEDAVRAAQSCDFDLVFMDVNMPKMNGIEATRRIRALPGARSGTKIVALTASVLAEDVADCIAAGMNDVLSKPVAFEAVLRCIRKNADNHSPHRS